jgi:hypothetical protein
MGIQSLVEQADTIRLEQLTVTLHGLGSFSGTQSRHTCIPKNPGELAFTMNTIRDFGLPKPYDFDIAFVGLYLGVVNGAEVIRWDAAPMNFKTQVQGHNVFIDAVSGGFHTRLESIEPSIKSVSCTGTPTALTVFWSAFRDLPNVISVSGRVNISPGIDRSFAASADDFWIIGESGIASFEEVKIEYLRDGCGIGASAGQVASFWAKLSGVNPAALSTVKYAWVVNAGGTAIGASDQWSFMVRLDDSASVVTVAVTVSIGAIDVSDSLTFAVETEQSIKAKSLLCLVKRIERRNFPVFPLSDPLRDLVRFPYTASELTQIIALGEYQTRVAKELLGYVQGASAQVPGPFSKLD